MKGRATHKKTKNTGMGASGAFTPNRTVVLQALAAQAAISLENATLYESLRNSEEHYRRIVETASEGIWLLDTHARTTYVNQRMADMLGYTVQEMTGRPVFDFMTKEAGPEARDNLGRRRQGLAEQLDFEFLRKDGTPVWASISTAPIRGRDNEFLGALGMITDITRRKRAEQRLSAQYAVARVLAESAALTDAAPRLLQVVCENLGWALGEFWSIDRGANLLRCAETWHAPAINASEFIAFCLRTGFAPGVGLPGRVWRSGLPEWIPDVAADANFPRAAMTVKAGLRGAFAFPVLLGNELLGVMTFFVRELRGPDEELLKMLSTIGSQIGQFIERRKVEETLREREQHSRSLLRFSRRLQEAQTYAEALNAAREEVTTIIGYQNVWVYLFDEDRKHMKAFMASGALTAAALEEYSTLTLEGDRMLQEIAEAKEIVVVKDARTDERTNKEIVAKLGNRTIVNVPIFLFDRHLGSLGTGTFADEGMRMPTKSEQEYLSAMASHMAVSLDRIHLLTKRKRAEEALLESEGKFRSIASSALDAIIMLDHNGRISFWNEAATRIFGFSNEEALGMELSRLIVPLRYHDALRKGYEGFKATGEGRYVGKVYKGEGLKKDGTEIPIEVSISALKVKDQWTAVGILRDITERTQAEAALRKALAELEQRVKERTRDLSEANVKLKEIDHLKTMFIASMSHELRTPLNSVIGFSSILLKEWVGSLNPEQKENLEAIMKSGKHLLALINDVIDVTKIEAGKVDTAIEDFELHDVLSEVVSTFAKNSEAKGLTLTIEAVRQLMRTDRRRLLQSLLNLVGNAVKFTDRGTITIGASLAGCPPDEKNAVPLPKDYPCIDIFVKDTGRGINKEDITKLFQPFTRFVSPDSTIIPGTGLGLYLTKRLVTEVLKGDIMSTSSEGEGSVFIIHIPIRI